MVRPDYREIKYSNELYHYGMPRRSGRYPWGSGDRPYQSIKVRVLEGKLGKKFDNIDRTIDKQRVKANKYNEEGFKRENTSKNVAKRYYRKADQANDVADRANYKGLTYLLKYKKLIEKLNVDMNDDLKKRGLKYLDSVIIDMKSSSERFEIMDRWKEILETEEL